MKDLEVRFIVLSLKNRWNDNLENNYFSLHILSMYVHDYKLLNYLIS